MSKEPIFIAKNGYDDMVVVSMGRSSYHMRFPPKATDNLDEIYEYRTNSLHNLNAAERLMSEMETNVISLKDFLWSGSLRNDEFFKRKGYRKLIIEDSIVIYLVDESESRLWS